MHLCSSIDAYDSGAYRYGHGREGTCLSGKVKSEYAWNALFKQVTISRKRIIIIIIIIIINEIYIAQVRKSQRN